MWFPQERVFSCRSDRMENSIDFSLLSILKEVFISVETSSSYKFREFCVQQSFVNSGVFPICLTILMTDEDCKVSCEYGSTMSATPVFNGVQIGFTSFKCLQGFRNRWRPKTKARIFSQNYGMIDLELTNALIKQGHLQLHSRNVIPY